MGNLGRKDACKDVAERFVENELGYILGQVLGMDVQDRWDCLPWPDKKRVQERLAEALESSSLHFDPTW